MLKPISNHLRLHVESAQSDDLQAQLELPGLNQFVTALEDLTGYSLESRTSKPQSAERLLGSYNAFPSGDLHYLCLSSRKPEAEMSDNAKKTARQMGQSLIRLIAELQTTRAALWQREAELATAVPVVADRKDRGQIGLALQSVLRGAVECLGATAAAMYVLDDATSQLKLRSHWGLPSLRFVEQARPLRGAMADLEALTGHVVVIEDSRLYPNWEIPEECQSAVCVPISGPNTILGTLWLFCDEVRDFTSRETHLLELISGRLVAELERPVLLNEASQGREYQRNYDEMIQWREDRYRLIPPLVDGWSATCSYTDTRNASADFHYWRVLEDEQLIVGVAGLNDELGSSMLTGALIRGALQSQLQSASSPQLVLQNLNEIAWASSPAKESAAMFLARIHPETGTVLSASAGHVDAYVLRPHGWEPIVTDGVPLGVDTDTEYVVNRHQVAPGDILLAISDRDPHSDSGLDTTRIAETLLRHMHLPPKDLTKLACHLIRRQVEDRRARCVLVVKRGDES